MKKRSRSIVLFVVLLAMTISAFPLGSLAGAEGEKAYGPNEQFWAEEPLTVSLLFSDHENYPSRDDWLFWEAITEMTNVTLELVAVPRSDYGEKRNLLLSTGEAPDIIAKVYPTNEIPFVNSGVLLPISEYLEYLPNFTHKIEQWNLQQEVDNIRRDDGKNGSLYMLPGLHEKPVPGYTLAMRLDVLAENGLEVPDSWDEFYDVLKALKEIYPDQYIFSDSRNLESTLTFAGPAFGTKIGWGAGDGTQYDPEKDEFFFYPDSDEYKEIVSYFAKLVSEGLLDPESFTQADEQAIRKLATEESFVLNANVWDIVSYREKLDEVLGEGNYVLDRINIPSGPNGGWISGGRLESGIAISASVLDNPRYGEILQFIDWLWYSDAGQMLCKWGVEGVTYEMKDGRPVLMEDYTYLEMNVGAPKNLQIDAGFSGGNFSYAGSWELTSSTSSEAELQFLNTVLDTRELTAIEPQTLLDEEAIEEMGLISTSLIDFIKQETMSFMLGTKDIDTQWDAFIAECMSKRAGRLVELKNEGYQRAKEVFGD